jgi:hypothetical protein
MQGINKSSISQVVQLLLDRIVLEELEELDFFEELEELDFLEELEELDFLEELEDEIGGQHGYSVSSAHLHWLLGSSQ